MSLITALDQQRELGGTLERRSSRRLDRMTAILEDNRMRVQLGGKDRLGILLYLTRLVYEFGLDINVGNVSRMQDESVSAFLVTGPTETLRLLADRLESEREQTLEGEVIVPFKTFDLTVTVPNRNGLILDLCELFRNRKVNIKSLNGWLYMDLDDNEWACIKARVEVTREMVGHMQKLEQDLDETLRNGYDPGDLDGLDLDDWRAKFKEPRPGTNSTSHTRPLLGLDNPLE
jgi:glycine cleavage system regulatory protein